MGRRPISQPPGVEITAEFILPSIAPKNITEERISRINFSGISAEEIFEESTIMLLPSRITLHPRFFNIFIVPSVSDSLGQLCITDFPSVKTVAASIGKTLFLDP